MKFLILSIKTIKGINSKGVPNGIKWQNIILEKFNQPKIIIPNHKGNLKVTAKIKWDEQENE